MSRNLPLSKMIQLGRIALCSTVLAIALPRASAQNCNITLNASSTQICYGDSVNLDALGFIQGSGSYTFDFNNQSLPAGWSITGGATFATTPNCAAPSLDNSPFYWSSTSTTTPEIQTTDLDVSAGGNLSYEFRMKGNSGSPCETADQYNEGILVEYSINGGGTWLPMVYHCPVPAGGPWAFIGGYTQTLAALPTITTPGNGNGSCGIYDNWANYDIPIPAGAQTTSTRFRWRQPNSSGSCCDNWGLDNITVNSGAAVNYTWSTGLTGQGANLENLYNVTSDTCVVVTITDSLGTISCSDSICIEVNTIDADFTFNENCGDVQFNDQSTTSGASGSTVTGWDWDFDDMGNTSNQQNPAYQYNNAGTYNVELLATSSLGCVDSITIPVTLTQVPIADFTFPPNCGMTNTFSDNGSTGGSSAIVSFDWDFGDGNTGTGSSVSHTYASSGTWNVTLVVTNADGCTDTVVHQFTNGNYPVADFTVNDVCFNDQAMFNDQSAVPNATIVGWDWQLTPTVSDNNQNPTYTYASPGSYNVTLVVTSDEGCTDTVTKTVNIWELPTAAFTATEPCFGNSSVFQDISTSNSGAITTHAWTFGHAGVPGSGAQNPTVSYPDEGSYNVQLTVTSAYGCVDSVIQAVNVWAMPIPDFTAGPLEGCYPFPVVFDNLTTISSGAVQTYTWDFGDNTTSDAFEPSKTYPNAENTYSVSLYVNSDHGCDTSITKLNYITVHPLPTASFTYKPTDLTVIDNIVQTVNLSVLGQNYLWDFGYNGDQSTAFEPSYQYPGDTGTYTITLIATTQYGCNDTTYAVVHVNPTFTIYIPDAFTPNDDGLNDFFQVYGMGITDVNMMIFNRWGENIFSSTGMDPVEKGWNGALQNGTVVKQDVYTYKIIVTDINNDVHNFYGKVNLLK